MGHYYAEMACEKCGNIRCWCPMERQEPNLNWMVDSSDMTILTVDDFDKKYNSYDTKYGKMPGMPLLRRMGCDYFKHRSDAEKHLIKLLEKTSSCKRRSN